MKDDRIEKAALWFGTIATVFAAVVTISKALEASCYAYKDFSDSVDKQIELEMKECKKR